MDLKHKLFSEEELTELITLRSMTNGLVFSCFNLFTNVSQGDEWRVHGPWLDFEIKKSSRNPLMFHQNPYMFPIHTVMPVEWKPIPKDKKLTCNFNASLKWWEVAKTENTPSLLISYQNHTPHKVWVDKDGLHISREIFDKIKTYGGYT